ncbi:MAG: hypothetical protein FWE66_01820, partial [Oscillospiraceae bacterium]|nr:hypothetical protein [Oscillospiraceae bacterium]
MRKHQQKRIFELVDTIRQAQAAGLLADCQSGALMAGEFIESVEGEGTKTVPLLEEYCELLYSASMGESDESALDKQLELIEQSVGNEFKPRIEMAFLSYKASMSDSIESIYLAAKADPDCDAYWIPIPYFEYDADGSVGEMLLEGAEYYGDDMECTSWLDYDVEARRPDAVFTFAPYDKGNYVTSVHPQFYCKRLRDLTDLLVYVPYFVSTDDVPEQFCTVAGCVYAHKVIVQSEKVRDTYIRVFKEAYGDSFGKAEDKFVALGSPKFDKVLSSKRSDFTLPAEWERLTEGKKIILYNTTVSAILSGEAQYLKKLRWVFDVFRDRSDVILWWRPHPLSGATYRSLRPQLQSEYEKIVEDFKREGFGIYDDSPELHRAIAYSDAYYGDASSLVALYRVTGKPIMIQNAGLTLDSEVNDNLAIIDLCDDGENFWFLAYGYNALFKMDKQNLIVKYVGSFPNESFSENHLYSSVTFCDDKLFFAPSIADEIAVYDIKTGKFIKIGLVEPECMADNTGRSKFTRAVMYNNSVFLIGFTYPAIVRLNTDNYEISYYDDWVETLDDVTDGENDYFNHYCVTGNLLALPARSTNSVVIFDMQTLVSKTYKVSK